MVQGGVPVASDGVIALVLRDIDELRVIDELLDDINGSVSGVVIDHDHIVFKCGLLIQGGIQRVTYSADPVFFGMTTDASYSKVSSENSMCLNFGSR